MKKALVVGLNNYPNGYALGGCVNDAVEVAKCLERHGNDEKNFDVISIYDKSPRGCLKASIEKCFDGSAEIALFYFAGHGMLNSFGGHIIATDNTDADLSLRDILEVVNTSKCANKVVILDSCFSGNMGNATRATDTATISDGVTILTACTKTEAAVENGKHGVFTELFLAALDGEAADLMGNVTPGGIYAFIDKSLGAWEQRPVFKTNVTTFSPLRKVTPPIDVKILRNLSKYFTSSEALFPLDPSYEYTNTNEVLHEIIEPYASAEHTQIMKELQRLERVGLVVPSGTEHMYYAAMESKSCQLTAVGKHYWRLAKNRRI
jgi:uncharacterized caspase-like protein